MSLLGGNHNCVPYGPLPARPKKRAPNRAPRLCPLELRAGMRRLIHRRGAMRVADVAHHLNCGPAEVWELLVDDDKLGVAWRKVPHGGNGAVKNTPHVCLTEDEPGPVQDIDGTWRDEG